MEWDRKIHLRVGNRIKVMSVADRIRLDIMSGRLRHLEYVEHKSISKQYGVSGVVAREALKRLLAEGFLDSPWLGPRVVSLTPMEAWEVTKVRAASEPVVLRASVPLMTWERIEMIRKIVDRFDTTRDKYFNAQVDNRLVRILYIRDASKEFLTSKEAKSRYLKYRNFLWQSPEEIHRHQEDFRRILTLCERRDAQGAEDTVRSHILNCGRTLRTRLRDLRGSPLFHYSTSGTAR